MHSLVLVGQTGDTRWSLFLVGDCRYSICPGFCRCVASFWTSIMLMPYWPGLGICRPAERGFGQAYRECSVGDGGILSSACKARAVCGRAPVFGLGQYSASSMAMPIDEATTSAIVCPLNRSRVLPRFVAWVSRKKPLSGHDSPIGINDTTANLATWSRASAATAVIASPGSGACTLHSVSAYPARESPLPSTFRASAFAALWALRTLSW